MTKATLTGTVSEYKGLGGGRNYKLIWRVTFLGITLEMWKLLASNRKPTV